VEDALEVSVDDAVAVEVVDGTEDGADGGGCVVLGEHAPCEDAVEELVVSGELKGEVVLCIGLEALVEFDLGG